jgi:hypothetical protein
MKVKIRKESRKLLRIDSSQLNASGTVLLFFNTCRLYTFEV